MACPAGFFTALIAALQRGNSIDDDVHAAITEDTRSGISRGISTPLPDDYTEFVVTTFDLNSQCAPFGSECTVQTDRAIWLKYAVLE